MELKPPDLTRGQSGKSDFSFEDDIEVEDSSPCWDGPAAKVSKTTQIFETLEELRQEEEIRIEEVVDCTGISPDDAFLLLRRHGWDPAAFNEAFFENSEEVRCAAGVSEPDEPAGTFIEGLCAICFTESGIQMMPCELRLVTAGKSKSNHPTYCRDCWQQFVQHSVHAGKHCLELRCPTPGCAEAVRPGVVVELLSGSDEALLERYHRFQAESFVDDSRGRARWCPGQGCGRAALEPCMGMREVECTCGTTWCFGCGTDAHLPVSCDIVKKWEEKSRDEGQDTAWIRVNTKLCPKCANPIEKNGGCMHMTCRRPGGCGHEFCWICMENWNGHKTCNGEAETANDVKEKSMAKSSLMRYAHFFDHYVENHKAQQFAANEQTIRMRDVADTICLVNGPAFKISDVDFMFKAVREIVACRRFLKWTYAFAFFKNFPKKEKDFFEYQQGQLQGTLERLCDIMENTQWDQFCSEESESHRPFYDLRAQIIGLTDVVHDFFSKLQEAIQHGTLL
jgi:ariadne-1